MSTAILPQRPVDAVLSRLHGVRETAPGRWTACCPAHEDRSPSLAIREMPDGKVLLKCWAGCSTSAVLAALGLRWSDLFPRPLPGQGRAGRLTRAEREAAKRAQADAELRRRLNVACDKLHRRLCAYYRAINLALLDADLETCERLAGWVHALPWLEHLLDDLEAEDFGTRLSAAKEAARWLIT